MKLSALLISTLAIAVASSALAAEPPATASEAPKIDPKKEFNLVLTIGDIQVIAAGLGALPFSQAQAVAPVLEKLKTELEPQLPKSPPEAPAKK